MFGVPAKQKEPAHHLGDATLTLFKSKVISLGKISPVMVA